jgi:hypothetical protein
MKQLRKQLAIAAAATWFVWLLLYASVAQWSDFATSIPKMTIVISALSQLLLWIGVVLAAGAVFTHVLMVRDDEMYEALDGEGCCADGCCQSDDQSSSSS